MKMPMMPCSVASRYNRPVWVPATTAAHKAYSLQPDKMPLSQLEQTSYISPDSAACVTGMTRSSQHEATGGMNTEELTQSQRRCRPKVGVSAGPQ